MEKHAIGDLMEKTMARIREMVDVNTIVGSPITTVDGITLIPVSKVSFGFAAGGSDFQTKKAKEDAPDAFGGGSGAGVKIEPVSFLMDRSQLEGASRDLAERILAGEYGDVPLYTGEDALLERLTGFALSRGVLAVMRRPVLPLNQEEKDWIALGLERSKLPAVDLEQYK